MYLAWHLLLSKNKIISIAGGEGGERIKEYGFVGVRAMMIGDVPIMFFRRGKLALSV